MTTSTQITAKINNTSDPQKAEQALWNSTRYLVAQKPASPDSEVTKDGYYKGCHVIPGPKANPKLSPILKEADWSIIKHRHFIRFVDTKTTQNADSTIGRAEYTRMDKQQADEYERVLKSLQKSK